MMVVYFLSRLLVIGYFSNICDPEFFNLVDQKRFKSYNYSLLHCRLSVDVVTLKRIG